MKITKEQKERILKLDPYFFKVKLEVGRWYKFKDCLFCYQKESNVYGFSSGEWDKCSNVAWSWDQREGVLKATEQEVFEALANEAVKRGIYNIPISYSRYKNSNLAIYRENFDSDNNILWSKYGRVFDNGTWATIIKTITKQEAEKLLNKKIV